MKDLFMSRAELQETLPWSKNVVSKMIHEGIFTPIKNPVCKRRSKMFFWRPQIEEAISSMINTRFQIKKDQGGKNGSSNAK